MEVVILPKKENLLNQVFSRLQVIDSAPSKNGKTYWLCKCACGNTCIARADQLKSGRTKSCGCLNKEQQLSLGKHNIQDITNQKFGHLTAIKRLNSRQNAALGYDWLCQCDCGNSTIVSITLSVTDALRFPLEIIFSLPAQFTSPDNPRLICNL